MKRTAEVAITILVNYMLGFNSNYLTFGPPMPPDSLSLGHYPT